MSKEQADLTQRPKSIQRGRFLTFKRPKATKGSHPPRNYIPKQQHVIVWAICCIFDQLSVETQSRELHQERHRSKHGQRCKVWRLINLIGYWWLIHGAVTVNDPVPIALTPVFRQVVGWRKW